MATSNFPQPPNSQKIFNAFPADLLAHKTDTNNVFCTQIDFVTYSMPPIETPKVIGGVFLPIPKKLNEVENIVWEQTSATSLGANILSSLGNMNLVGDVVRKIPVVGNVAGILTDVLASGLGGAAAQAAGWALGTQGYAINPFLWMLFKSPTFKEHVFSWTFVANNEQESQTIVDIIKFFKKNALPSTAAGGVLYTYPNIALIKFWPDDVFTFKVKPCAVVSVQVDYTGSNMPSFYNNGAPTVVNLSVVFKEIELWKREDL